VKLARIATVILTTLAHWRTILKIAFTATATRSPGDFIDGARVFAHGADVPSFALTEGLTFIWLYCTSSMLATTPNASNIAVLANVILNTLALWSANFPAIFVLILTGSHESRRLFCEGCF
jgi:hypothetical protein